MRLFCLAVCATLTMVLPFVARAQSEPQAPIVKSATIIEALESKNIVLDQPGQAQQRPRVARRDPSINLRVQFGFDSAELTPHGQRQLDELASALSSKTLATSGFAIIGHTDQVGDANYNLRLSLDRANSVKQYLHLTHGLALERLQTIGLGFSRLADNAHPRSPVNRRVEVRRIAVSEATPPYPAPTLPNGHGAIVNTPK